MTVTNCNARGRFQISVSPADGAILVRNTDNKLFKYRMTDFTLIWRMDLSAIGVGEPGDPFGMYLVERNDTQSWVTSQLSMNYVTKFQAGKCSM